MKDISKFIYENWDNEELDTESLSKKELKKIKDGLRDYIHKSQVTSKLYSNKKVSFAREEAENTIQEYFDKNYKGQFRAFVDSADQYNNLRKNKNAEWREYKIQIFYVENDEQKDEPCILGDMKLFAAGHVRTVWDAFDMVINIW